LKAELENLKILLHSYERQNLKVTELEIKLRNLQFKYDKEIKKLDDQYKDKLSNLNKSLQHYEDIIHSRQNSSKNLFSLSYIKAISGKNSFIEEEELDYQTVSFI
jgi:hypothetical protein